MNEWQNIDIKDVVGSNIEVEDYAVGKNILELCNHPEAMTKKAWNGYDGKSEYCGTHHPNSLTVDLKDTYDIGLIQFLLFDSENDYSHTKNEDGSKDKVERLYHYRVLIADDYTRLTTNDEIHSKSEIKWKVIYDSKRQGYRNWQFLHIEQGIKARFIRLHCVFNQKNAGFHIVRLRAYSKEVGNSIDYNMLHDKLKECDKNGYSQLIKVSTENITTEIGDGFPLSKRIYDLANLTYQIAQSAEKKKYLQFNIDKEKLTGINSTVTSVLEAKTYKNNIVNITCEDINKCFISIADDITVMEKNSNGMRRLVLDPIAISLDKGNKFDKIWNIISIVLAIIPWIILFLRKIF